METYPRSQKIHQKKEAKNQEMYDGTESQENIDVEHILSLKNNENISLTPLDYFDPIIDDEFEYVCKDFDSVKCAVKALYFDGDSWG